MNNDKTKQHLDAVNALSADYSWWGADYEADSDVLVLHASKREEQSKQAQLFFHNPQYLCRPSLQGRLQFSLMSDVEEMPVPLKTKPTARNIVILRACRSDDEDVCADFAVISDDVEFTNHVEFSHDEFHHGRNTLFHQTTNQGSVLALQEQLALLNGEDLAWRSISSVFNAEFSLSVLGHGSYSQIVVRVPFFINLPKLMHNVYLRPPTQEDVLSINSYLEPRWPVIQQHGRTDFTRYVNNVLVIDCDEGSFFMYTKGIGFCETEKANANSGRAK